MGIEIEVNFKFEDKDLEKQVRQVLNQIEDKTMSVPDGFKTAMASLFPDHNTAIDKLLAPTDVGYLISEEFLEHLHVDNTEKAKRIEISALVGEWPSEDFIKKFMTFIFEIGGTPLMCYAYDPTCIITYKLSKKGKFTENYLDYDYE